MEFLELHFGENPWPMVIVLLLFAAISTVVLMMTQNGRHLIRALIAVGVAGILLLIDLSWTTDREKLASIVSEMVVAVSQNDMEGVRKHLSPKAVYYQNGLGAGVQFQSPLGNTLLKEALLQVKFDFMSVRDLNVSAGRQTKRGKADFQVFCAGTWQSPIGGSAINFPPTTSAWKLGFQKQKDGNWLVDDITPTQLPGGQGNLPSLLRR